MDATDLVESLSLVDPQDKVLWTLHGPFSREMTAGMMVAGYFFLKLILKTKDVNHVFASTVYNRKKKEYIYDASDISVFYRPRETPLTSGLYGFRLLNSDNIVGYDIYSFTSTDFIDGFIAMALGFKADIRNYIYPPIDSAGNERDIDGYNLASVFPALPFTNDNIAVDTAEQRFDEAEDVYRELGYSPAIIDLSDENVNPNEEFDDDEGVEIRRYRAEVDDEYDDLTLPIESVI